MLNIALNLVRNKFAGKVDKAGKPYIRHLERVYRDVAEGGGDIDQCVIALLHDIIEDTDTTEGDLVEFFPNRIVRAVFVLTKRPTQSYMEYISLVKNNEDSLVVKLADLRDNMDITRLNEITDKDVERLKKYHTAYKFLTS